MIASQRSRVFAVPGKVYKYVDILHYAHETYESEKKRRDYIEEKIDESRDRVDRHGGKGVAHKKICAHRHAAETYGHESHEMHRSDVSGDIHERKPQNYAQDLRYGRGVAVTDDKNEVIRIVAIGIIFTESNKNAQRESGEREVKYELIGDKLALNVADKIFYVTAEFRQHTLNYVANRQNIT